MVSHDLYQFFKRSVRVPHVFGLLGKLAPKNGFGSGGHVVCAILSPLAIPGSFDGVFYHYSLLRTLEDGFGLSGYLGNANDVTPINTIWH